MPADEASGGGRRRLLVTAAIAGLVWLAALGAAPVAAARAEAAPGWLRAPAAVVYLGASFICHQRPQRSYHVSGVPQPICARCLGIHAGVALGLLVAAIAPGWLRRRPASQWRPLLLLAAAPTAVSVGVEWLGGGSTLLSRTLTALPAGLVVGALAGLVIAGTSSESAAASAPAHPSATLP